MAARTKVGNPLAVLGLLLLSGVLLPFDLAPPWLRRLSYADPFRWVVDALRALFAGDFTDASVPVGSLVALVLAVGSLAVGRRVFARGSG